MSKALRVIAGHINNYMGHGYTQLFRGGARTTDHRMHQREYRARAITGRSKMKTIVLAMLAFSSASAQEQGVILFGDLIDPNIPGFEAFFDVFFTWNISSEVASNFGVPFCDDSLGPQAQTVTVKGNQLIAVGACASQLGLINWSGEVDEQPPNNGNWFGGAVGVVAPTAAPEPGTRLLMLTGLLLAACARGLPRRYSLRRG